MKKIFLSAVLMGIALAGCNQNKQNDESMTTTLTLTQEWDKVFPKSDKVDHKKVTFKNRFGIELAADLYTPKGAEGKLAAIAVSGPFGAVKEQSSGLYAQTLAEHGFLTIAFDPSYTGESGGEPRYVASPDINTEDFSAAVDFLSMQENVDAERIGILGVCGWGGIALNAAALDPRIKAAVASTMYDMSRVAQKGYFDSADSREARMEARKASAAQRMADLKNGTFERAGGVIEDPTGAPWFVQQYHAYYKTPRGYHERSLNSTEGWSKTGSLAWMNAGFLKYTNEIENAVLVLHGELAHSRYFGVNAYEDMTGAKIEDEAMRQMVIEQQPGTLTEPFIVKRGNKQLYIVPGATHCDLYDGGDKGYIPFDYLQQFFTDNLR